MNREQAREAWVSNGLGYEILSHMNVQKLEACIDAAMRSSALMRGTFRIEPRRTRFYKLPNFAVEVRCKSHYFSNREAITFNTGGFIGFGGWADDINIQPILSGFVEWVDQMRRTSVAVAVTDAMVDRACRARYSAFDDWTAHLREDERYKMRATLAAALEEGHV